jgi:anti-sigma regulatory factor (Ser/Thr protein kinase)
MEDLALHMLDIMENSIRASAHQLRVLVVEDSKRDVLAIEIEDDGKGMDETTRQRALDPFFTTKTTRRVGLGIPLLAQAARESEGSFEIASTPGKGTTIRATFRRSHPDRKALGDIPETIRTILQRPELSLRYEHRTDDSVYCFDTSDVKPRGADGTMTEGTKAGHSFSQDR